MHMVPSYALRPTWENANRSALWDDQPQREYRDIERFYHDIAGPP